MACDDDETMTTMMMMMTREKKKGLGLVIGSMAALVCCSTLEVIQMHASTVAAKSQGQDAKRQGQGQDAKRQGQGHDAKRQGQGHDAKRQVTVGIEMARWTIAKAPRLT